MASVDVVDRVRLGEHRARVAASLDKLNGFVGCTTADLKAHPGGAELLALDPDLLVSVALVTIAGLRGWPTAPGEWAAEQEVDSLLGHTLLDALRRRRLPWRPDDAELALRAAMAGFDQAALVFALGVARTALQEAPGDSRVYAALTEVEQGLLQVGDHIYQVPELRQRVRALLAAQAPGGLLDTSVLQTTDGWGGPAREAFVQAVDGEPALVGLLAVLTQARGSKPSRSWEREVETLVAPSSVAAGLLQDLLVPIPGLDLTPARAVGANDTVWPSMWLVTPANAVVLRGAAWATHWVDAEWVPALLGHLALRGAARHPQRYVTTALCAPLASGAVEALSRRHAAGDTRATAQLRLLREEITRRDLLKRVNTALDVPPDTAAAQDAALARAKRQEQARKANPLPKLQRTDLLRLVRRDLAPVLRDAGFDGTAATFVRTASDHQACVQFGVNDGRAQVRLGVRYGAFAPDDRPASHELDVTAYLVSGAVGPERWTWDLGLGLGGDDEAAARLCQALLTRGLLWLAAPSGDAV